MPPVLETRAQVGLVPPRRRTRIPGPVQGTTAHYNGPKMLLRGEPHSECQRRWRGVQNYHMKTNDWDDVAYSAAVCFHEIVMEGRGPDIRTAANGTTAGNNGWFAIFFMVGDGEEPSAEMLRAAEWYARIHLNAPRWNRHSDHKPTACAGPVNKYIGSTGRILTDAPSSGEGGTVAPRLLMLTDPHMKGTDVVAWQRDLRRWRSDSLPVWGPDGDFGDETDVWTRKFQNAAGLAVDGKVGPNTRGAMDTVLRPPPPTPAPEPTPPAPTPTPTPTPTAEGPFTDVPASHPQAETFRRVKELGLIQGYADGSVRPGQPVTRTDLAIVVLRLHDLLKS